MSNPVSNETIALSLFILRSVYAPIPAARIRNVFEHSLGGRSRTDPMGTDYLKFKGGDVYYQGTGFGGTDAGTAFRIGHTDGTWITLEAGIDGYTRTANQAALDKAPRDNNRGIASINVVRGPINDVASDTSTSSTPKQDRLIGAANAGLEVPA